MTAPSSSSTTNAGSGSRRGVPTSSTSSSASSQPTRASPRPDYGVHLYDQRPAVRADASPTKPSKLSSKSFYSSPTTASASRRKMNGDKTGEKRRSSRACLECRLAKTKCHVTDSQDVCDRCAKFSFDCRFVRHHRGRKPVSKLASMDTDDLDGGGGMGSRFGASDDEMGSESDSAGEDGPIRAEAGEKEDEDGNAAEGGDGNRSLDHEASAGGGSSDRKGREATRSGASRSNSKARAHRAANALHELDTSARRRIWEMLAQKIPQRGSTYTFVSKGEVAHDNLQASGKSSSSKAGSSSGKRVSSPSTAADGKDRDDKDKVKAEDQASAHASDPTSASSQTTSKTSGPSQHFASTFRNLLRPVDKRAAATTAAEEAASAVSARYPRLPATLDLFGPKDPVDSGILSMAAARRLYAYYFEHLNPWGMNFDPSFVSHDAVRASSSFLYSTILYLASRYIELADGGDGPYYGANFARPRFDDDRVTAGISAQLGSHVRSLAVTAFAMGDRRMETGVAMYLSSVWKEADDHFTILYCSYAAKIMSDIPTELLSLLPSSATRSKKTDDATPSLAQQRQRRNQQRQFLFHFIQEHTHLLHFAPRPNFDRGPSLLRNLLAWADDALATQDDILLCADIDSVLLQTKYKSIMERAQAQEKDTLYGGSECFLLLQSFMDELEGWTSRWELQARKIDQRFRRDDGEQEEKQDFANHLPLDARMHLLGVMRSSLVMQISSIAFRASLRDINKAKPTAKSTGTSASAFSPSALSAMDDRAEQIYYTCLDSALNLLVHTMQMPSSILRHAQDMIMVLAPHAALLATYLVSLPLPSLPPNFTAAASERMGYEYAKVKTRIRRRKEYERKCLELMRETRESFRLAQVREDDHVGLCALYFDSLLNVIEGETEGGARQGRSLLSGSVVVMGGKRSRSVLDAEEEEASVRPRGVTQLAETSVGSRSSSAPTSRVRGAAGTLRTTSSTNVDTSAAETLLNLHSEANPHSTDEGEASEPGTKALGGYYPHSLSRVAAGGTPPSSQAAGNFSPGGFISSGMFGHFAPPAAAGGGGGSIPNSPQWHHGGAQGQQGYHASAHTGLAGTYASHPPTAAPAGAGGEFGFGLPPHPPAAAAAAAGAAAGAGGTVTPTGATGTSTPVDWTWLQSFLEVPEFSWM